MISHNILAQIQAFEQRARAIEHELARARNLEYDPTSRAIRQGYNDLMAETVGNIANGIASSLRLKGIRAKTHTKRLLREKSKNDEVKRIKDVMTRSHQSLNDLVDEIDQFTSHLSINKSSLRANGNSNQLKRMFGNVKSLQRPSSKISSILSNLERLKSLELIENEEIPTILSNGAQRSSDSEAYEMLRRLENEIRALIKDKLSALDSNWWKRFIPEDVRRRAEERKSKNDRTWSWISHPEDKLLEYVDFTDYSKILTRKDNWRNVFGVVFKDEISLMVKLKELEPIRNQIAHARRLTRRSHAKLDTYSKDILEAIRKHQKK